MEFFDKLILGHNTPKRGEHVRYPDKPYKLNKFTYNPWEFWAMFLVKNCVDRNEAFLNISSLQNELRFAVWDKLCSKNIQYNKLKCTEDINFIRERDNNLLQCVLQRFQYNNEEKIFSILRRIVDTSESITDFSLLVEFTFNILNLPNSSIEKLENILNEFFIKQDFKEMFCSVCDNKTFKDLVYNDVNQLYKKLDLFLVTDSGFNDILNGKYKPPRNKSNPVFDTVYVKEETYFDFLIVQNETIKAQEIIKNDLIKLTEENLKLKKQLEARNNN